MTTPQVATTTIAGKRHYIHPNTGQTVPSVTTILDVLDKPALTRWAAKSVAEFAVANKDSWTSLPADAAVDMLKGSPWRARDKAAATGTDAHSILESFANGVVPTFIPPGVPAAVVSGLAEFWTTYQPKVIACEQTVWNATIGYAGSFDLIAELDGVPTLIDLKTSSGVYGTMGLQLAAYARGEQIIAPDGQVSPMPQVAAHAILHVPQDGKKWRLVPMDVTDAEFAAFCMARGLYAWRSTRENSIAAKVTRGRAA